MRIELGAEDAEAFAAKLEQHNTNRASRNLDPVSEDDYAAEVLSALLGPERLRLGRERADRLAAKVERLPEARRTAILDEIESVPMPDGLRVR